MKLKQNRRIQIHERQKHFPTQYGRGVRDVLKRLARGTVTTTKWVVENLNELVTLGKAGYDIYSTGKPQGLIDSINKVKKRVGDKEQIALKKLIGIKQEEIKKGDTEAKKELKLLKDIKKNDEIEDKINKISPPPKKYVKKPVLSKPESKGDLLSQIREGKVLKKTPKQVTKKTPRKGSLEALLAERRAAIEGRLPEPPQGGKGAKMELLKLAKKQIGKGCCKGSHQKGGSKLSNVLDGIATASAGASVLGPEVAVVSIPLSAVSSIASGIAKMFGSGISKGKIKPTKTMTGKGLSKIGNEIRSIVMKNMKKTNIYELAKMIVQKVTGNTPKELVDKVAEYIKLKL